MIRPAYIIAMVAACSPATTHRLNQIGAATMAITLAGDWCTTRSTAADQWDGYTQQEVGFPSMIIGQQPQAGAVDVYSLFSAVALFGAAQLIPARYRPIAYGSVTLIEGAAIASNLQLSDRCPLLGH